MEKPKVNLSVDTLVPGMVVAESVFNQYGAVIIWQDTELDAQNISRLSNLGIHKIHVYKESVAEASNEQHKDWLSRKGESRFELDYLHDSAIFRDLFVGLTQGQKIDQGTTDQIVESVLEHTRENSSIVNCVMQVRSIDEYTYCHSVNVSMLAMLLGRWLGMPDESLRQLVRTGLLHDIGKSRVPMRILNKPARLTDDEFKEMKRHTEYGYLIVKDIPDVRPETLFAVLSHHEREDGSGYPLGITGNRMHQFAKIISIVDIFDAMTANRVYKKNESPFKVFELMQHGSFGVLDPTILTTFLTNITHYYVGKEVNLSDGNSAEVVFMNHMDFSRPVVRVNEQFIDLTVTRDLSVLGFT